MIEMSRRLELLDQLRPSEAFELREMKSREAVLEFRTR
jgi:hypothetical protein